MGKQSFKAGTLLSPLPCVMVSLSDGENDNIITIAWTGIINSDPPMTYISVRPSRHSYEMLKKSKEFVINMVSSDLVYALDYCGSKSGRDEDKFQTMRLSKSEADYVNCPMIAEAPINLECRVTEVKELGSHDMFMAEILSIHVDDKLVGKDGRIAFEKAHLVAYVHGQYYELDPKSIGSFGYSVMKPKTAKRRRSEGKKTSGNKPHWETKSTNNTERKSVNKTKSQKISKSKVTKK